MNGFSFKRFWPWQIQACVQSSILSTSARGGPLEYWSPERKWFEGSRKFCKEIISAKRIKEGRLFDSRHQQSPLNAITQYQLVLEMNSLNLLLLFVWEMSSTNKRFAKLGGKLRKVQVDTIDTFSQLSLCIKWPKRPIYRKSLASLAQKGLPRFFGLKCIRALPQKNSIWPKVFFVTKKGRWQKSGKARIVENNTWL